MPAAKDSLYYYNLFYFCIELALKYHGMYALGGYEAEIFILLFLAPRKTEAATAGAVVLYVSQETWLKSILDRNLPRDVESSDEEDIKDYQFEDDLDYLRSLDPKEWKDQDHYAVLGIAKLRNRATEDIIKKACKLSHKQKNLIYHFLISSIHLIFEA